MTAKPLRLICITHEGIMKWKPSYAVRRLAATKIPFGKKGRETVRDDHRPAGHPYLYNSNSSCCACTVDGSSPRDQETTDFMRKAQRANKGWETPLFFLIKPVPAQVLLPKGVI